MSTASPFPLGAPCWADLGSTDPDAARAFYSAVLGWVFDEPAAPVAATRPLATPGDDRTEPDLVAPSLEHGLYADDEAERAAIRRSSASGFSAAPPPVPASTCRPLAGGNSPASSPRPRLRRSRLRTR